MTKLTYTHFSFFNLSKSTYFLAFMILCFHLFLAWQWPMLNDETYYWDWGRNLQLSYIDAPPAISWLSFVSSRLFEGPWGARFLVPFLYFFSTLFLVNSFKLLYLSHSPKTTNSLGSHEKIVVLIFAGMPLFNLAGIVLMPDAPLIFATSGALFFALNLCKNKSNIEGTKLNFTSAIYLGVFLGLGIASKYQGIPVSIGIFIAIILLRGIKNTFKQDMPIWAVIILTAGIVSSPLFIWNIQNDFASFKFQGEHGFSSWSLNLKRFLVYIASFFLVNLPWYSYLFLKQLKNNFQSKQILHSLDLIPISAFLSIFLFIGASALGNASQIHWITPSVLFLIPLLAAHWDTLISNTKKWQKINLISFVLSCAVGLVLFTSPMQNILSLDKKIFGYHIKKMHDGLYRNFNWANLKNPSTTLNEIIPNLEHTQKFNSSSPGEIECSQGPFLVSLSWRWASQFAFHLKNNPRVLNISLGHANYYVWRDFLPKFANCPVYVLGEAHMFNKKALSAFIKIEKIKYFQLKTNYTDQSVPMVFIEGNMRDTTQLENLSSFLIKNPTYY